MWHFCGKTNNQKLEKIQERALRILYNDYTSTYNELLDKAAWYQYASYKPTTPYGLNSV